MRSDTIFSSMENLKNEDAAIKMSAYMRNQFSFLGVRPPERKSVCKEIFRVGKKNKTIDWEFLDDCWENKYREMQYIVLDYLSVMQKFLTYDDVPKIKHYVKTKQWWDTIDGLDRIVGDIGIVDDRIDALMLTWSRDEDFWIRRLAIDHQLSRKERTNKELLEEIILNNLGSNEFFINKAIGWSLRDYSKVNPHWVGNFIKKYQDEMNSLSIREGSKYL
ncbi:DNA alkylation repair enzyme [Anaerotignum neopropionicum]|uniref:DNA alkylation repair enzyme n=1 Tax=Anaerotignum neopropionicum TaxID=36847 RepID=A0A136WDZ5_9FIRM|nr:DNA alkylation repair protein [Anaerotignum neopropionicum]KXL52735.1 DNA alkylation repair enzyme [Anaerotignum neopropionicum]